MDAFRAEAGGRLDQLERRLGAGPAGAPAGELKTLQQRRDDIERRLRELVWRSETEWRATTGRIEGELEALRRELDRVSGPGL
ncbi:MAG: hypothetical protein L0Y54_23485 [Sporichthyaceae bacterium]|nr:hypothetical protein [Sporichthyaceae bacterium]